MGPEQNSDEIPKQQEYLAPTEEVWHLKECEMSPVETRNLGYFLYVAIFAATPTKPALGALYGEYVWKSKHPEDFRVGTLPATLFVEKFAQMHGMKPTILTRWANAASIELATHYLPLFIEAGSRRSEIDAWKDLTEGLYEHQIIRPVTRVSKIGLRTTIQDHRSFLGHAFELDKDLGIRFGRR